MQPLCNDNRVGSPQVWCDFLSKPSTTVLTKKACKTMKKQNVCLVFALVTSTFFGSAWSATHVNAHLSADSKAASSRYNNDKKLCNDETTSTARLQCRRDAKAEYDQAIAAAKAKDRAAANTSPAPIPVGSTAVAQPAASVCRECGRILSVAVTEKAGEYSAVGVIAGGALGAVLGNQVGGGFGKDLATLAGAAGGAYAGKTIEEKIKTHRVWSVSVVYANESRASFDFTSDPGFQVGDRVKNTGNTIARM